MIRQPDQRWRNRAHSQGLPSDAFTPTSPNKAFTFVYHSGMVIGSKVLLGPNERDRR
ncbi:hypothetical protein HM1_0995 [Heliomicrobium modesticaldum Ice1]|uniref:Uncharacterized protein n=1 Tax=Heliobacterium modesticaldum (strain ATCC 51547 / Ice1) TaxID=498761 RepID=B0TA36_HELMI|nr:hypothetical protein HM1_0995 [Heliomicrobium modesticaldum Ice1]